ncbi:hypothetical protein AYO38_04805 [bacterium SCGC AG-212-C10]|nr:hypothetical protein AYO38_04805 [bacterium SCGC AG-212-C10]
MQDRPTIDELLEAVANFLTDDVMPATTGRVNFHARVSANAMQTIRRELQLQEEHFAREWDGLDGLLGEVPRPASLKDYPSQLEERNRELVRRIDAGDVDEGDFRQRVFDHLRVVTHDKLSVTNPGWLR